MIRPARRLAAALARFARPLPDPSLPEAAAEAALLLAAGAVATLALVAAGLAG